MSLKRSVVLVNEFTIIRPDGSGSRGASPGKYVRNYMARQSATEVVAPAQGHNMETFIRRYMLREQAVERLQAAPGAQKGPEAPGVQADHEGPGAPTRGGRRTRRGVARTPLKQRRLERSLARARARALRRQARAEQSDNQVTQPVAGSPRTPRALRQTVVGMVLTQEWQAQAGEQPQAEQVPAGQPQPEIPGHLHPETVGEQMRETVGYGWAAFGNDEVSLSHAELLERSEHIQQLFQQGHTVLKTVLSFRHDYLVEHGLVPADMECEKAGDYRGQLDQMKLRMAIMQGLRRMGGLYDDLRYVGVIQVDTEHVHAHLALVDAGRGHLTPDGTQRGKINARAKSLLRRGIDSYLDQHQVVAHLSADVGQERRNVVTHVKRWAYEVVSQESQAQFLVSCLPRDRRLWRAGSHHELMERPNRLVRELVEERLAQPDSPLPQAMEQITRYADTRTRREGLSVAERERLVDTGRERIIEQAVNGVYGVLAALPEGELDLPVPPVMSTMAQDYDLLLASSLRHSQVTGGDRDSREGQAAGDATVEAQDTEMSFDEFSLRLRSYTARLDHHRRLREEYAEKVEKWEWAWRQGRASEQSQVIADFWRGEERFHSQGQAKYQHFLDFLPASDTWRKQWQEVEDYGRKVLGLKALRADKSLARMQDRQEAERLGRDLYGQPGGYLLSGTGEEGRQGRNVLDERIRRMTRTYRHMVEVLQKTWARLSARLELSRSGDGEGMRSAGPGTTSAAADTGVTERRVRLSAPGLSGGPALPGSAVDIYTPGAEVSVVITPEHDFRQVRGVDLHHMHYDWPVDQPVSAQLARDFQEQTRARRERLEKARAWLQMTQPEQVEIELGEAERDIARAERTSAQVGATGVLRSDLRVRVVAERQRRREAQVTQVTRQGGEVTEGMGGSVPVAETPRQEAETKSGRKTQPGRSPQEEMPVDRARVLAAEEAIGVVSDLDDEELSDRTFRLNRQVSVRLREAMEEAVSRQMEMIEDEAETGQRRQVPGE